MNNFRNDQYGWMIRDTANVIRGPYSHAEILQLLKKGQLKNKTELAQANSYWFAVEEKGEVDKFFPELSGRTVEMEQTATLTKTETGMHDIADDNRVDITQFTPQPTRQELKEGKVEWLSDEFAEEFGEFGTTMHGIESTPIPLAEEAPLRVEGQTDKEKMEELLKRATVKQDVLPSEYKDAKSEKIQPITNLLKTPSKPSAMGGPVSGHTVQMPTAPVPDAAIKIELQNAETQKAQSWRMPLVIALIGVVLVGAASYMVFSKMRQAPEAKLAALPKPSAQSAVQNGDYKEALRKAFLLYDMEIAKNVISEMELSVKANILLPIARAILSKEFLFNIDAAVASLESARSLAQEQKEVIEIENMLAIYSFEREPEQAIYKLRQITTARPEERLYRLNLATALLRMGKYDEAEKNFLELSTSPFNDDRINFHIWFALGWVYEASKGIGDARSENAFKRALELDPLDTNGRLMLAVRKLKKGGAKEAETDFKIFLESLPELEQATFVKNFRLLPLGNPYDHARQQIREHNSPSGSASVRPSALIMAVDGMLSAIQGRLPEAEKIVETAISLSPGNPDLTKAMAFVRYKQGRIDEVPQLLTEALAKQKNSFALQMLLASASLKSGRLEQAEKALQSAVQLAPERSDAWSLLGDFYYRKRLESDAKRNYQLALTKNPNDLHALRGLEAMGEDPILTNPALEAYLPF